jgi:hypothetical protein
LRGVFIGGLSLADDVLTYKLSYDHISSPTCEVGSPMSHFTDQYMDRVNVILHNVLTPTWFYRQEIIEVEGVLTAMFITYDGVRDDWGAEFSG